MRATGARHVLQHHRVAVDEVAADMVAQQPGTGQPVQIVSSLVPYYTEEQLLGRSLVVLTNLKPAKFGGQVSEGMLLCAETPDGATCVLLGPQEPVPPGTPIT